MNQDEKNLELLSIFHYILGGITALMSLVPVIYIFLGAFFLNNEMKASGSPPPPAFIGLLFIFIGAIFTLCGFGLAISMIIAGKRLKEKRSRMFCLIIAGIECILMPFGTVLGVFSIVNLTKESVIKLFDENQIKEKSYYA